MFVKNILSKHVSPFIRAIPTLIREDNRQIILKDPDNEMLDEDNKDKTMPMSCSSIGTSSPGKNRVEVEVVGKRPTGCLCNSSIRQNKIIKFKQ